jgi:hypothetical protein
MIYRTLVSIKIYLKKNSRDKLRAYHSARDMKKVKDIY